MNLRLTIIVVALLASHSLPGQQISLPKIVPPSPEASAIGKFGDIPVGTYTGIPNISFPLYQINVRDISFPITLNYHGSGVRVEEEASWVGLSWALESAGMVTRTIRGNDDFVDEFGSHGYAYDYTEIPPIGQPVPTQYVLDACQGELDPQPDIFTYDFMGSQGKFVLKRRSSANDPIEAVFLSPKDKTTILYDGSTESWTIFTDDGYKGIFSVKEYSRSMSGPVTDPRNPPSPLQWDDPQNPDVISTWYLEKIISPTNEEISFEYDIPAGQAKPLYASRSIISISETKSVVVNWIGCADISGEAGDFELCSNDDSSDPTTVENNPCENSRSYSGTMNVVWNVYLRKIKFRNGELQFNTAEREDIEEHHTAFDTFSKPRRLDNIQIFENGELLKTINFSFGYFNDNHSSDTYLYKRLQLTEVHESSGADEKDRYSFSYIGDSPLGAASLPPKNSAARDYWGLYNDQTQNNSLYLGMPSYVPSYSVRATDGNVQQMPGADLTANEAASMVGTLKKITYPTGGYTEFSWESNTFAVVNEYDLPREKTYHVIANDNNDSFFELTHPTEITLYAHLKCAGLSCYPGGSGTTPCTGINEAYPYLKVINVDNNVSQSFFYDDYNCKLMGDCEDGVYATNCGATRTTKLSLPNGRYRIMTLPEFGINVDATITYKQHLTPNVHVTTELRNGGGIRVSKIVDHDGVNSANDIVREFKYTKKVNGMERSTGKLMSIPAHQYTEFISIITGGQFAECTLLKTTSSSNIPLGRSAQGSPVGYDQVTIFHGENGENGYSVYEYKNERDIATEPFLPNAPTINHTARNGLLMREAHYSRDGAVIKETVNTYSHDLIETVPGIYVVSTNQCGATYGTTAIKHYEEQSEWWKLLTTTTKIYDTNDPSNTLHASTVTEYTYNSAHRMVTKKSTTTSKGDDLVERYYYPLDVTSSVPQEMWDQNNANYKHLHGVLIKSEKFINTGSGEVFISGLKNEYQYDPGKNMVLLDNVEYALNGGSYQSRVGYEYDNTGNIKQVTKDGVSIISYLWDYNNALPVAQVSNAAHNQAYYQGFETYIGATNSPADSRSGKKYKETSFAIPFIIPDTNDYELSYWKYENDEWTLVIQPYTGPVTLTADRIDDVRVHPKNAQMVTYNYDPLIGTRSTTDQNGQTTFFEYDDLQRLFKVKDFEKNTLVQYKYQYKQN